MQAPVLSERLQTATDRPGGRAGATDGALVAPRLLVIAALIAVALAAVLHQWHASGRGAIPAPASRTSRLIEVSGLPAASRGPLSAALGAGSAAYLARPSAAGFRVSNPGQRLQARFGPSGVTIDSAALEADLSLRAVGYGTALVPAGRARPTAAGNRVTYRLAGLGEWYANGPLGIEQGFTVARGPGNAARGPLTLAMALGGNARAALSGGGRSITLSARGAVLRYGRLVAVDAAGRQLRSWLAVDGRRLLVRVDTAGARFPVRIDPLVEQARLEGPTTEDGEGNVVYLKVHLGRSVAVSADGDTALVGGPTAGRDVGTAWVFTRSGSTWTEQAELFGQEGDGKFGRSVALSADGNTALIGDPGAGEGVGAAWVYTRSGSSWSRTEQLLPAAGEEVGDAQFGDRVALSGDGDIALIGAQDDNGGVGAAWVFARSGGGWAQQAKLEGSGSGDSRFGRGLALSGDGSTAIVGGLAEEAIGTAWVYTNSGGTWPLQAKLQVQQATERGDFGGSVALSADGDTALIGGLQDATNAGSAWAFTRSPGGEWSQQGPKLTGSEEVGESSGFGGSVALSAEGNLALIGGHGDDEGRGAAWVFALSGSTWTQQGPKLTGGGEVGDGEFGDSVALAAGGTTALIGALADNRDAGATWVFASPLPSVGGVEPAEGPAAGGTRVTITGSEFTSESTVTFGGVPAEQVSVESADEIKATAPPGVGAVDVTVTTAGGASPSGSADRFSYRPSLAKIAPARGAASGGTPVTITGSGFTEAATVSFGSTPAEETEVLSSTSIVAIAPPGAGVADVTVTTTGGTTTTGPADRFAFVPVVETVEPAEGPTAGGTLVTIAGAGFTSSSVVRFGASEAEDVTYVSPTQLTARSPAGSGVVEITVQTAAGTSPASAGDLFGYANAGPITPLLLAGTNTGTAGAGTLPFTSTTVPPPTLGVTGNIAPVSGTVFVRLPGTTGFVLLSSLRQVPFGTLIDALDGRVVVTTIGPHGTIQTGEFFDGEFILEQGRNGMVVARLAGGRYSVCPTARERGHIARAYAARTSGRHVVRKLWANAHGSFSTRGTYAAGAVQGTEWLTEDLCDGTLIKVTRDKVKVTNLVTHHTLVVHVGHSYLAKAP